MPAYLVFTSLELCRWRSRSAQLSFQVCDTRLRSTLLSIKTNQSFWDFIPSLLLSLHQKLQHQRKSLTLGFVNARFVNDFKSHFRCCPTSDCLGSVKERQIDAVNDHYCHFHFKRENEFGIESTTTSKLTQKTTPIFIVSASLSLLGWKVIGFDFRFENQQKSYLVRRVDKTFVQFCNRTTRSYQRASNWSSSRFGMRLCNVVMIYHFIKN